jgi:hypothetical protein
MVRGQDEELRRPAQGKDCDARALVLPGEPVVDAEQARPAGLRVAGQGTGRHPVRVDVERDAEEGLVLLRRVIDAEHHDVGVPIPGGVGDGHAAPLVLPREPAGHVAPV